MASIEFIQKRIAGKEKELDKKLARIRRERAWGAYHALLQVKFEIEDNGTKREGRGYLTIV